MSNKTKNKFFKSVGIFLLEILLFGFMFFFIIYFFGRAGGKPCWYETHAEASSVKEAEEVFGESLMLDILLLSDHEYPYRFRATLECEEFGSIDDKSSWNNLGVHIIYYTESKPLIYEINLKIFFNNNDYDEYYKTGFDGKEKTRAINGINISYIENEDKGKYPYYLSAKYKKGDSTYFFSVSSREGFELNWRVLEQYLSYF